MQFMSTEADPTTRTKQLSNFSSDRYLWRHSSTLNTLLHYVSEVDISEIFVDLPGYGNPSNVFHDAVRPECVEKKSLYYSN